MEVRQNEEVDALVQGFRANLQGLHDSQTLEAVVRQEYIDPFWNALGWDVANRAHASHAEKDVVIEAPVMTLEEERRRSRRPDYLFRIGGFPRFVVEAKKPAVDLKADKESIFQAKTYAWSAQIPFAILTNFSQFRLFDATLKPYFDEPNRGLIADFDLRFEDYPTQWDVLESMFGRAAVADGSLEKLLARIKHVRVGRRIRGIDRLLFDLRGTEPVDHVFLSHLEDFRLRFARAIHADNAGRFARSLSLSKAAELTEATQRLIDRLVFMRACEDRGIIPWGRLRDTVNDCASNRVDLYSGLVGRFREFDRMYNGYLFKPHFSEELRIPAQLLADFIRSLYPPDAPYRFDAIGDDLLGVIYERFLGGTITVENGQVRAEPKPEVRHAGGVYYTPRFVVDTIIRRVIGPQLEGKKPLEVLKVRVLDPACGSGSFLIAAFGFIMDYCRDYIAKHPGAAEAPVVAKKGRLKKQSRKLAFLNGDGQWWLTPEFRSEILTSCIFGVDIDQQAVEVSIMSLYLKTLEGKLPNNWQRELGFGQLLPALDNNIRCGNSLLSQTDFDNYLDETQGTLFPLSDDVRFRINAFDWSSHTRGFGRLFGERPGFDCIIGNPPYIRVQELNEWASDECVFYKWRYRSAGKGNFDIYVAFLEKGLDLLSPLGQLGFICPHKFWQATYGSGIRQVIAAGKHLRSLIDFGDQQVFRKVTTYTAVHVLSKAANKQPVDYARIEELTDGDTQCRNIDAGKVMSGIVRYKATHPTGDEPWVFVNNADAKLLSHIRAVGTPLKDVVSRIFVGLQTSADDVFILEKNGSRFRSEALAETIELEKALLHPLLKGSVHIRRWWPDTTTQCVLFPYEKRQGRWQLIEQKRMREHFPKTWKYLSRCRERLAKRERGTFEGDRWHGYVYPKNLAEMGTPKILTPSLGRRSEFCFDEKGEFYFVGSGGGGGGGYGITLPDDLSPHYLLGLLNSRLLDWFVKQLTTRFHSGWYAYNKQYIEQVPIKIPKTSEEVRLAKQMIERVKSLIECKRRLESRQSQADQLKERLAREIESHEQRIDTLVLRLYEVKEFPQGE